MCSIIFICGKKYDNGLEIKLNNCIFNKLIILFRCLVKVKYTLLVCIIYIYIAISYLLLGSILVSFLLDKKTKENSTNLKYLINISILYSCFVNFFCMGKIYKGWNLKGVYIMKVLLLNFVLKVLYLFILY